MVSKFLHYPLKVNRDILKNAWTILCNTHDASSSFLDIFEKTRKGRKARGTSTDEEQDLLRAMLTFASSGLDSMVKQIIRDALRRVISRDEGAHVMFKAYIDKKLKKSDGINTSFLADIISDRYPQRVLYNDLIYTLTSGSLQSKDELLKTASYFNIESKILATNIKLLENIFKVRNQILHEMDIDFTGTSRNRRQRRKNEMVDYTNEIFRIADIFLREVDNKLSKG